MAGKNPKIRLFYTSLDIVVYAALVFTAGVMVGFAVGRYKQSRFYFAEKRLDAIDFTMKNLTNTTNIVRNNMSTVVVPSREIMAAREPNYGCTLGEQKYFNFTRNFTNMPDVLMNVGGIKMSLADSPNTQWFAKVEAIGNKTGLNVSKVEPPGQFGLGACWIAIPGLEVA